MKCIKLLPQNKLAKFKCLRNKNQINRDNTNNVKHKISSTLRNNKI